MKNERLKKIIAFIILLLIIAIIVLGYLNFKFKEKQIKIITSESNILLDSDVINNDIDLDIKSKKSYGLIEYEMKKYISDLKDLYNQMVEINFEINPNKIFVSENLKDEKMVKIDEIIEAYKERSQKIIEKFDEKITEPKIVENIKNKEIPFRKKYYIELYNEVMLSEVMKNKYILLEDELKNEKSRLYSKLNKIDKIKEFLINNSENWNITEGKIKFTNLNKMVEYYNLLNQLAN